MQENARDLLREFEKEYSRDNRDVRQQKRVDDKTGYFRGGLPGHYTARRLFG